MYDNLKGIFAFSKKRRWKSLEEFR